MKSSKRLLAFILIFVFALSGCGKAESEKDISNLTDSSVPFEASKPGEYDSKDTAVISKVSDVSKTITFYNYELKKSYTLSYDDITKYMDAYGTALTVNQLKEGKVVDILFLKSKKLLVDLRESDYAFAYSDITDFDFDAKTKIFNLYDENYKIDNSTLIIYDNKKITLESVNSVDTVSLYGIDKDIYALVIEKSHGNLTLKHYEKLIGGQIEIGTREIADIKENLDLVLPEGDYHLVITKDKLIAEKDITIYPNQETKLDLSDIEIEETKYGKVLFEVSPEDAEVYVDGRLIENSKLQELGYGRHKLEAVASGYEAMARYFTVGEEKATLSVKLEATEEKKSNEKTEEDKTEGYFIFVSSPVDVEVSVDGNYVGKAPVSFPKKSGVHSITLRKNGCITRTYSVLVENDENNVFYNFEDLEKEKEVSGNN